jgi:hypothetical protein
MGKGSTQRPKQVSDEQLQDNWDLIFKGDKMKKPAKKSGNKKPMPKDKC